MNLHPIPPPPGSRWKKDKPKVVETIGTQQEIAAITLDRKVPQVAFRIPRTRKTGNVVYTVLKKKLIELQIWHRFWPIRDAYRKYGKTKKEAVELALKEIGGYDDADSNAPPVEKREAPSPKILREAWEEGKKRQEGTNEWNLLEDMKWVFQNLYTEHPKRISCPSNFAWGFLKDLAGLDNQRKMTMLEKFIDRLLPNRTQMDREHSFAGADRILDDTITRVAQTAKDAGLTAILQDGAHGNGGESGVPPEGLQGGVKRQALRP